MIDLVIMLAIFIIWVAYKFGRLTMYMDISKEAKDDARST